MEASASPPPPGLTPGIEFFENFCLNAPLTGRKAIQMPPPLAKFLDYCFNFSVASIKLLRLCMLTWFIRQHIFIY